MKGVDGHATWVTLFVDMVDSTGFKYKYPAYDYWFIERVTRAVENARIGIGEEAATKFTGDGAMVVFRGDDADGCGAALLVAERILLDIERANLRNLELPPVRVRMGITTGRSRRLPGLFDAEVIGRPVDLAARLCEEAEPDTILIDKATKDGAKGERYRFPARSFERCDRRLALKGVPLDRNVPEEFYYLRVNRLLNAMSPDTFPNGLLALFPNRSDLLKYWSPIRLVHRAVPGSTVLVAGRTLTYWTNFCSELRYAARAEDLHFKLLLSSEGACRFLLEKQQQDVRRHLPDALEAFTDLAAVDQEHFEVRISDHLIIDGITCAYVRPPTHRASDSDKLIVIQDINAGPADNKSSQLWGCNCRREDTTQDGCPAHGLLKRTEHLFDLAHVV